AYGVTTRTIRNGNRKAGKAVRSFWFGDNNAPDFSTSPDRLLLLAQGKKLHEQLIKARWWDKFCASIVLHGIDPDHITDPGKQRLWETATPSQFLHPAAAAAIQPENALQLAAAKLRLAGVDVTRQTLARELGVSVRTLYRPPHGAEKLRAICGITRKRKPKIDSGEANDLAA